MFISGALSQFDKIILDGLVNLIGTLTWIFAAANRLFDVYVIDGLVNLSGWITSFAAERLRRLQTGLVQNYLLFILIGIIAILAIRR